MALNEIHLNWNHSIDSTMRLLTDKIIDTMGKAGMQRRSKTSNPNSKPCNTHDSENFWKTISIYKKRSFIQGNISLQEWHQFYDKLLSSETSTEYILPMLNTLSADTGLLAKITMKEIIEEISRLKNCKAAGIDEVPNEAIKLLPHSYLLLLKDLYNRILRSAVFPSYFSRSIIQPIFKNGDSDNPSNYRGISLLSNFAKLFIAILRSRLVKWIETNDIIPENQAGFRSAHSCQDHIFILTSVIQLALRKKRGKCYSFFVDLKKAFDTVPHALLWTKLVKIGLNYRFVNLIKRYYEDMTAAVRWNNSITEFIEIRSGVLQGDPLSPCLFLLFINDLIKIFDDSGLSGIYLPNFGNIHLLLYAADIVLIGDSKINLQLKINILKTYLETNLLTLNENKSRIMVFRNGGKVARSERWYWGQSPLSVTSKYTYLGYPLTLSISFTQVALNYRGRTMAAMGAVGEIILKSKLKSFLASMRLLDSMILTVLLYAAPIWAHDQTLILDRIRDTFLRRFLCLPSYTPGYILRAETGRNSLDITVKKLTLKFWTRILKMDGSRLPFYMFGTFVRHFNFFKTEYRTDGRKSIADDSRSGQPLTSTTDRIIGQAKAPQQWRQHRPCLEVTTCSEDPEKSPYPPKCRFSWIRRSGLTTLVPIPAVTPMADVNIYACFQDPLTTSRLGTAPCETSAMKLFPTRALTSLNGTYENSVDVNDE
ncbi:hypothetical protein LAZ67_7002277 [Cordylochernes scorpioides]|uniref:Reverse transcriptase domain-containing protein n=1 Tax=Cordylochernes scorpioides TaxID=51811 RepID=A0ABY6KN57_9ARAC|nr:hypothetical protein LAZ67_7002277 [Cordylochernes scorpioides]